MIFKACRLHYVPSNSLRYPIDRQPTPAGFQRRHRKVDRLYKPLPPACNSSRLCRKVLEPMLCNIDATAKPDAFEAAHVLEQPDQPSASSRPSDQPVMQTDGEKLRRAFLAFAVENVERVAHVGEKLLPGREAAVLVEAIVVGFIGIGDDQVGFALNIEPIG